MSDSFSIIPCSDNLTDVKIKEEITDDNVSNEATNIAMENSSIKTEICEETKISDCDNTMSMLNTQIDIKEEICDDTEPNDFIHSVEEEEYLENTIKDEIKSTELDDFITIPKKNYSEILKKNVELILKQMKPHKCSICNKSFEQKGNLRTHIWKKHSHVVSNEFKNVLTDKPNDKHSCSLCFKSYPYMSVLKKHMKLTHDFSAKMVNLMEIDLKETQIESAIKEILHQEDPLTISDNKNCHEVESSSISNLTTDDFEEDQSLLKKNEQKKDTFKCGYFKCPFCPTEFRYFDSLKIHIGRLHGAGKTKPKENYKKCEAHFSNEKSLKVHTSLVHEKLALRKCDFCGKDFSGFRYLHQHIAKMHRGQKVTVHERKKCDFCGKIFSGLGYLHNHIARMHGGLSIGN